MEIKYPAIGVAAEVPDRAGYDKYGVRSVAMAEVGPPCPRVLMSRESRAWSRRQHVPPCARNLPW